MQKTSIDIERDMFALVKGSALAEEVNGDVYRSNMRPPESELEDIVVRFTAGVDSQIQTGVVSVNIYTVSKRLKDGMEVDDKNRCGTLLTLFYAMIEAGIASSGYDLSTDGSPRIEFDNEAKKFVICGRIRYRYLDVDYK